MAPRNDILVELQEIAPAFAGMGLQHPYQVPVGYFDGLADVISSRIRALDADSVSEELQMISPTLAGLKKDLTFRTPEGYFEKLSPVIPELKKEPRRVVRISFGRLAAAAVIAGLILTGAWIYFNQPASNNRLAMTEEVNLTEEQTLLQKVELVSDEEIVQYIDHNYTLINFYNPGDEPQTGEEFEDDGLSLILAEVSDQELENYLAGTNF